MNEKEELKNTKEGIVEKPDMVDTNTLKEITEHLELKAFIEDDEVMGKHIVLYVNKGEKEDTAVGVSLHPSVSKKLLCKLKEHDII